MWSYLKNKIPALLLFLFLSHETFAQEANTESKGFEAYVAMNNQVSDLAASGKWDSAIWYQIKLEAYTKTTGGAYHNAHVDALYGLGELYRIINDYHKAYVTFKEAYEDYRYTMDSVNKPVYALILGRLGSIASKLGAYEEARSYLEELFKSPESEHHGQADFPLQVTLADIYMQTGDYLRVDSIYEALQKQVGAMPPGVDKIYQMSAIYNNLAELYNTIGNNKKALTFLKQSVRLNREARRKNFEQNDFVQTSINLSESFLLNNQLDSAIKILKEANDSLNEKTGIVYANVLKVKAIIFKKQHEFIKAIDYYNQYKKVMDSMAYHYNDYLLSMVELFALLSATHQYQKADSLFLDQIDYLHKNGLDFSASMQETVAGYCNNLIFQKRYEEAVVRSIELCRLEFKGMNKNFPGLSENDKLLYKKQINKAFDLLYVCLFKDKTTDQKQLQEIYNLELQRQSLILNYQSSLLMKARGSGDSIVQSSYKQWLSTREMLSKQLSLPYKERSFNTDSLQELSEQLEKGFYGKNISETFTTSGLSEGNPLNHETAKIQFVRFNAAIGASETEDTRYAALARLPRNGKIVFVPLCREQKLLSLLKNKAGKWKTNEQVTADIYAASGRSSRLLYEIIWKPIEQKLQDIKYIFYTSSGLLNNISFQAINDGKTFLVNKYIFTRYFSLPADEHLEDIIKPKAVNIWGNIDYNNIADRDAVKLGRNATSSNLSNTFLARLRITGRHKYISKELLQAISTNEPRMLEKAFSSFHVNVIKTQGKQATEERFKQDAENLSDILHISTHGFYTMQHDKKSKDILPADYISANSNPLMRCGLAFAGVNYYWLKGLPRTGHDDGILTGYEIAVLDLHKIRLVTISACETGLGDITDNEGNFGLQRAFKQAGASTMLVTLWRVPIAQTAELFALFYRSIAEGLSPGSALQQAQKKLQKKYPPFFWGGFVIIK